MRFLSITLGLRLACAWAAFGAEHGAALAERFQAIERSFPPLQEHYLDGGERWQHGQVRQDAAFAALTREKLEQRWFAALIASEGAEAYRVDGRFQTWRGLLEFLQHRDAVVEVWAYGASAHEPARRIPATELDELRRTRQEQPHYVTVTYREENGAPLTRRLEFGFEAARLVWEAHQGYWRHRNLAISARAILDARNEDGHSAARAQWSALTNAVELGEFEIGQIPTEPKGSAPLFVAVEFSVDENGNYRRAERLFREDEITPAVEGDRTETRQILKLNDGRQAEALRPRGLSDELEVARNTLAGQDEVQLRIRDAREPDARKWAVLEFGAPEVLRRAALARFALINAQMERRRKEIAFKKSNVDLVAEPIIAGLNIGGGIAGVGAPLGEIARVFYNAAAPKWISKVPSVEEMREVFAILAARERDPVLSGKPAEFLTKSDIQALRETGRKLSDEEVQQFLANITDEEIDAMIRLARMGMIDARVTNFLNLLTSVFRVTRASEQAGLVRDIFNNVRFAPNGDINLKTLIALAAGKKVWTPLSGVGLYDLSRGDGASQAWAQFFEVSVDFRAVANSVARWFKPTLGKKELEKPFPYATRLGDLAAYEFRAFGFPLLLFYKRGLIREDLRAYENDYAYGVIGTKQVVRYPTKEDLEREILAGRLFPLGLVKVPDGFGKWKETTLPVFANKLESGRDKGKIALVIYGLQAYHDYSELMEREWQRFQQFERALKEGAVIERVIAAEDREAVPAEAFEPEITVGEQASETIFAPMLAELLEIRRTDRLRELGLQVPERDKRFVESTRANYTANAIALSEGNPLVEVDRFNSAFVYRRVRNGKWELVKMASLAGLEKMKRTLGEAEKAHEVAELRRAAAAGEADGVALVHAARAIGHRAEVGPLIRTETMPEAMSWIEGLPILDRARLVYNRFASTLVELDLDGNGTTQRVFLAVEFPLGRVTRTVTNALSGVVERQEFENGRPTRTVSERQIVEFDYTGSGTETETRTYWNVGSLGEAEKGALLKATRTLRVWHRDMARGELDPYVPVIEKLRLDYVTGQAAVETFGLFPLPVSVADDQFVTTRRFDERGRLREAVVAENGGSERLGKPVPGRERFRFTREGEAGPFRTMMRRDDLARGLSRMVVFNDSREGRTVEERFQDGADHRVEYRYRDDLWFGALPESTATTAAELPLREVRYISFDPVARRTVGVERDYRGTVSTQVWDYRWSAPVETETGLRKTTVEFDRAETSAAGRTIDTQSGELVRNFTGTWNAGGWRSVERWWHSPNVPLRTETNWLSGYGRLLSSRSGGIESVPVFAASGREMERRVLDERGQVLRVEDDFRWENGRRSARVRRWIEGEFYDEWRARSDEEGRLIEDGIRTVEDRELATRIQYDRGTERRIEAVTTLGGEPRETRRFGAPEQGQLPVVTIPEWGLASTNFYDLGDPFGRSRAAHLEDGSRIFTTEWFPGTAIPRMSERQNREGRVTRRWVIERVGDSDIVTVRDVSPWGVEGVVERRAQVRGTDQALFADGASERIYFKPGVRFPVPSYSRRLDGTRGVTVVIDGTPITNATRVYQTAIVRDGDSEVLALTELNLLGLFEQGFRRQFFDRAGNLLREEHGRVPTRDGGFDARALFSAVSEARVLKQFFHRYDSSVWREVDDPELGVSAWALTKGIGGIAVNANGRETVTSIDGSSGETENTAAIRAISSQRKLKSNPWLPHLSNAWTEWTTSRVDGEGQASSTIAVLYNAQGVPVVTQSRKGGAEKMGFEIPRPGEEEWISATITTNQPADLPLGFENVANAYFVYFFLRGASNPPVAVVKDRSGSEAVVSTDRPGGDPKRTMFWPVGSGHALWSPDEYNPREGILLNGPTPSGDPADAALWAVPVAHLRAAGIDAARIASISLRGATGAVQHTIVRTVERVRREGEFQPARLYEFAEHSFSSGLRAVTRYEPVISGGEGYLAGWRTLLLWNGVPVLTGWQENQVISEPRLIVSDHSDPEAPRPLYALNARDGHFLQWFQIFKDARQTRIYSVVNGFESPRLEIFHGDSMADELRASSLAYGRDVPVVVPLGQPIAEGGSTLENLKTRVHASAFKYAGDRLLSIFGGGHEAANDLLRLNSTAGSIARQPARIARLPQLAQALAPFRDLPWTTNEGAIVPPEVATNILAMRLRRLATLYPTGLIPTAPDAEDERFVETAAEAELVQLAIASGAGTLARDVLDFYWNQSRGGEEPLFDFYDAENGASVLKSPVHKRPIDAKRSARSQLAVAEAAIHFAAATGDTNALHMGQRLLQLLLARYRTQGGISEEMAEPHIHKLDRTLLPSAPRFSAGTNARLLLFLRSLDDSLLGLGERGTRWHLTIEDAARAQEEWLRQNYLDHPERLAAPPMGLVQLQDVGDGSVALAPERWAASEDWLALIEAADGLGVPKEQTQRSLENLARAHGAWVGAVWGLDWAVPWQRPEAISARLTAKFYELARSIGYEPAAAFAARQLRHATNERGELRAVRTRARADWPLLTGAGPVVFPNGRGQWGTELAAYRSMLGRALPKSAIDAIPLQAAQPEGRDMSAFFWTAALFYLAILAMTFFWWVLAAWRKRRAPLKIEPIVPAAVMQLAEERWAKRVLGVKTPDDAERSRYSNGPVEENFHIQLRAIYKVVLEWRRLENGWAEDDRRLVEDGTDPYLNGMDEFGVMIGLYSRWVVKAGKKDGFSKADPFEENEDSNHIWSRLVFYLSEYLWGLLQLLKHYRIDPEAARVFGTNEQIHSLLRVMGARSRREAFDGRELFDFPAKESAMDILPLQLPGATLPKLAQQMQERLRIPASHFRAFLKNYKTFKHREQVDPIHPYIIEAAKLFPHFMLMGLVSVIWYNQEVNGLLIYPYLKQLVMNLLQSAASLAWAIPLLLGWGFSVAANYVHFYRYTGTIRSRKEEELVLDRDVVSFASEQSVLPSMRSGWKWDPVWYERVGWILRGTGLAVLGFQLMQVSAPSLATFMLVKGLFVPFLSLEAAAILVPLIVSVFSRWCEDSVSSGKSRSAFARFVNGLNLVPTRPASIVALSVKYHFQSSLPSGGAWAMTRCIVTYFVFTAAFFLIGSYSYKEVLRVWFAQRYHQAWDWELAIGSLIFWNTMYLLRFGLFIFFVSIASFAVTFPLQAIALGAGLVFGLVAFLSPAWAEPVLNQPWGVAVGAALLACLALAESWLKNLWQRLRRKPESNSGLDDLRSGKDRALAVVYMSGDDLSFLKLTPELLLNRLTVLREKLGSEGATVLLEAVGARDDTALSQIWARLHALEKRHDVTLWHPMQLVLPGETPRFRDALGLNLSVENGSERAALLEAWQTRRWLVTMMSTAGHGQDTGINLVDIALRLAQEGLSQSTAFYLIQNKYDNADTNRPAQMNYGAGELGHRNKLARLLMEVAPGARAYSINDWTPFGFKAGGMVGMDFIHEESLKLSNMLVLDRNANTHDLAALMQDLKGALADPGVIIVVPGRSTTNALTPLGQASQLVEEGHRALLKGVMAVGGGAGESVGTGWGNIQAISYGQVQRALLDPNMPKMPLTSRMRRGSSFHEKSHGLIGFGPHAVGISEDIWGVTQASHNALALGRTVKFRQSRAFWHKIRETWSHAEWFSAFPRWSGGYLQLMLDPLMQRINDFGPLSVFAKEIRANCGRFFLSVPFALLNILLMPLAIIYDVSPFVQILVVLWLFGLIMNQVLTMLGAVAYLESTGFKKMAAVCGGAGLGALAASNPASLRYLPAAVLLGFVAGGFLPGWSKWLYNRGRDLIVFGPQLVIHALGQFVRQSLEFVLSGASAEDARGVNIAFRGWVGPREDRPWESYANFINLRTVIWGVGLLSLALNLFALAHLDFLNALLLLPSLFFSISTLAGPFLMSPKRGNEMGVAAAWPKFAGWTGGFAFFTTLAFLLTREGTFVWAGLGLLLAVPGALFRTGLRYAGYARRLKSRQSKLSLLIEQAGVAAADAARLATQAVRTFQGDPAKMKAALSGLNLDAPQQDSIAAYCERELRPLIKQPVNDVHGPKSAKGRWRAEFIRSFALSLFTLVWFVLVPLPGLLVFSGLGYRLALPLPDLLQGVSILVAVALLSYAPVRLFERFILQRRYKPRVRKSYSRLRALLNRDGALHPGESSALFASLTDAITYADQRAHAYATRTLDQAEQLLTTIEQRSGK